MASNIPGEDLIDIVVGVLRTKITDVTFSNTIPKTLTDLSKPWVVSSQVDTRQSALGIGSVIGTKMQDAFAVVPIKGVKVGCTLQFDVWAQTVEGVNQTIKRVIGTIMAEQNGALGQAGVIRIALIKTDVIQSGTVQVTPSKEREVYRKKIYFETLGELIFQDVEEAKGNISSINVNVNHEYGEQMVLERAVIENVNYNGIKRLLKVNIRNKSRLTLIYKALHVLDASTREAVFSDLKLNGGVGIHSKPNETKEITTSVEPPLAVGHQYVVNVTAEQGLAASYPFTA